MNPLPAGQLFDCERVMLHEAVLRKRPLMSIEIGTWRGGGSTYQIVSALQKLGCGHLYTCDINPEYVAEARSFYGQEQFIKYCTPTLMQSTEFIKSILEEFGSPDFVFFDGSECPNESLVDFKMLENWLVSGAVFMMHDWLTPESHKADLLRPYLEAHTGWRIVSVLRPPDSVGLVEAVKI